MLFLALAIEAVLVIYPVLRGNVGFLSALAAAAIGAIAGITSIAAPGSPPASNVLFIAAFLLPLFILLAMFGAALGLPYLGGFLGAYSMLRLNEQRRAGEAPATPPSNASG